MMTTVGWCLCPCHSVLLGNARALIHRGTIASLAKATTLCERPDFDIPTWTNVHDALEAAVATGCSCLKNHAPALSSAPPKKPPYKPPTHWTPEDE